MNITQEHIDKFWSRVNVAEPDSCWIWIGGKNGKYGEIVFKIDGKRHRFSTHHFSCIIHQMATEDELKNRIVAQLCNNKMCVNPKHLLPLITIENAFFQHLPSNLDPNKCWEWQGPKQSAGYGVLRFSALDTLNYAHRISYKLHYGGEIDGLYICHHCDNPSCVNPNHLFPGTAIDNNNDKVEKGRHAFGERVWSSKLTESEIRTIRLLAKRGITQHEIADKFNVSRNHISAIVLRKYWKHLM